MTETIEIPTLADELTPKPALAAALSAFQAEMPRVVKANRADIVPREGRAYSYDYADLGAMTETVLPLLSKHGLAWLAKPTWLRLGESISFVLVYKLMHKSGEQEVGIWPLPDPSRARPQDLGSAITYARRYSFQALTGVAPAEDDDGAAAQNAPLPETPEVPKGKIEPGQARRIVARLTEMGVPEGEQQMAWITGITGVYTEDLEGLTRQMAAELLDALRPAGRQARTDVIGALKGIGLTEQNDVLARLADWSGREIAKTADLTVWEAGMAMRKAGQVKAGMDAQDQAGEEQGELL